MQTFHTSKNTPFLRFTYFCSQWFHLSHFFPQETLPLGSGMSFYLSKPSYDILHEVFHHCRSDPCYSNLLYYPSWDLQLSFYNCLCLIRSPSLTTPLPNCTQTSFTSPLTNQPLSSWKAGLMSSLSSLRLLAQFILYTQYLFRGAGQEGINTSQDKGNHSVCGGQGPQGGSRELVV